MAAPVDTSLICRLERAAVAGWPATVQERSPGGWLLRTTPGLDRARSNHGLPPCRILSVAEIEAGLGEVTQFADAHGIRPGIQVSPLGVHANLDRALDRRGWERFSPALVLSGPAAAQQPRLDPLRLDLRVALADRVDPAWLRTWERCEPGRDAAAHARTVFTRLAGRALFARIGTAAVGMAVPACGVVGMFCLAVDPERRRHGLGSSLVQVLLAEAGSDASRAYLQVEEGNAPARRLYEGMGFREVYGYCHRRAPERATD